MTTRFRFLLLVLALASTISSRLFAQERNVEEMLVSGTHAHTAPEGGDASPDRIAFGQGGYETSERASSVAPPVEKVLMDAETKTVCSLIALLNQGV